MKTAIVHHPIYQKHDTGEGHPETSLRYLAVIKALRDDAKLWETLSEIEAKEATRGQIQACHTPQHYKFVEESIEAGDWRLDADTIVSFQSMEAASYAAGGACRAVDAVMKGEAKNAFVAARPPGHHATADRSQGFCLFNNVAIAARYAQQNYKEIERVAIVDWDVHHGNGTQGIFYSDPSVYFFSMHQYPWYPGTGSYAENGFGIGRGFNRNLPVKANTNPVQQRRMFDASLQDISKDFKPDLILISAGFDGHISDPLGQLLLDNHDYSSMTKSVMQWADEVCEGRIVSVLEGGYNLETLGNTVKSHVKALGNR